MNPFTIDLDGSSVRLALSGEVTIQDARALTDSLREILRPEHTLAIDATQLRRLDAAALQILLAAAQVANDTVLLTPSKAWSDSFARYASPDPFHTT